MQVEHETETQCNPTATILGATGHRIVKFEYIPTGTARQESDSIEARQGDERSKSLKGLTQASLVNVDRKRRVKPKRAAAAQLAALIRAKAVARSESGERFESSARLPVARQPTARRRKPTCLWVILPSIKTSKLSTSGRAGEAGNDLESQVLAQTHAPLASPVSHTER